MRDTITLPSGTTVYADTDPKLIPILERIRENRTRIRVYYGDKDTGKCWNEEYDIMGYIGRTTGNKSLILVYNKRSYGGGILLTDCILKIKETNGGRALYVHPNFKTPQVEAKGTEVYIDGELYGRCETEQRAKRLANKMA